MLLKCNKCNLVEDESTTAFYKRTKKNYNNLFFCKFCLRIKIFSENPELEEKKREAHEEKISRKRNLKSFIRKTQGEEYIKLQVQENIELLKKKYIKYRNSESGKISIRTGQAKRRAKILNALVDIDADEHNKIRKFYANKPDGYHVDHIIPISKGGKHRIANLQYLLASENISKNDKIDKFLIERLCNGEKVTVTLLMIKFKLNHEYAKKIIEEVWF